MDGERYFCLSDHRRTKAPDLRHVVEGSNHIDEWKSDPDFVTERMVVPVSAAVERVTVKLVEPLGPDLATGFLRVRVERITE